MRVKVIKDVGGRDGRGDDYRQLGGGRKEWKDDQLGIDGWIKGWRYSIRERNKCGWSYHKRKRWVDKKRRKENKKMDLLMQVTEE